MADALLRLHPSVLSAAFALVACTANAQQHAEHAAHVDAPSAVDRAAAFPDLGDAGHMHLEDPLNRSVVLDRFESDDADGSPVVWDLDAWVGRVFSEDASVQSSSARRSLCQGNPAVQFPA